MVDYNMISLLTKNIKIELARRDSNIFFLEIKLSINVVKECNNTCDLIAFLNS